MKLWCDVLTASLKNEINLGEWTEFEQANHAVYLFDRTFPKPEPVTVADLQGILGLANEPETESNDVLKTAEEWFNECLPPDIAEKAIAYATANSVLDAEYRTLSEALKNSFNWVSSHEGVVYWFTLHLKYCKE